MTWDEFEGLPVAVYHPGMCFGEFEVYKNTERLFSCRSITEMKVLILEKRDFKQIFFRSYPQLGNVFVKEMNRKFNHLLKIMTVLQNEVFPELSNSEGHIKMDIIKEECNFLSRISEKHSFSLGKILMFRLLLLCVNICLAWRARKLVNTILNRRKKSQIVLIV